MPRRSPLHDQHLAAGARLVPFAGWEMPIQYEGIQAEHVRCAGRRESSTSPTWGRSRPRGPDAEAFLQHVVSNDVTAIAERGAQYGLLCAEDGGVLDDLFTYRLGENRFLTVTNASNHDRDLAWFRRQAAGYRVEIGDAAARWAMLAVQGPRARALLAALADGELPARMRSAELRLAGVPLPGLRHRLHRRGRLRAAGRARRRRRRLGGAAGRRRRPLRPRRPRHAAPGGLLPPLRQRPRRGPQPDRGRARLVLQAGDRLRRRRRPRRPRARAAAGPARRSAGAASPARATRSGRARSGRGHQRQVLALSRASGSGWPTCPARTPSPAPRLEIDVRGPCGRPR